MRRVPYGHYDVRLFEGADQTSWELFVYKIWQHQYAKITKNKKWLIKTASLLKLRLWQKKETIIIWDVADENMLIFKVTMFSVINSGWFVAAN